MHHILSGSTIKEVAFRGLSPLLHIVGTIQNRIRPQRLIVYYNYPDFSRKSEALADLLRRQGFNAVVRSGRTSSMIALLKSSPDLWIGFWNELPIRLLPENYIFWNGEPLSIKRWGDNAEWFKAMKKAKMIWGYSRLNENFIQRIGVPFHFVPFGYAPYYETIFQKHNEGKNLQKDIDVLFFGGVSERRRRILAKLKQRGMNVHVVSRANPAYGEKLDELLARSKIVIEIHYYEEPQAQIANLARLDHILSNRLFVLHERTSTFESDPTFEQNVTTCEYGDLPDACVHFIERPEERVRISAQSYAWFKANYALDAHIPYGAVQELLRKR